MLAAVLVVSLLIFKGYSSGLNGPGGGIAAPAPDAASGNVQFHPVQRASDVNPLIEETAEAQRKALEQQLQ